MSNTAIIGGGAAGITAAISAASNPRNSVTIYERGDRIGKKILATGNGRCNMTNINADINNYYGQNVGFMENTIKSFWVDETIDFFKNLGIITRVEDGGKVYPYSNQASAVLDVLRAELDRLGVIIKTGFEVKKITEKHNGFLISSYSGENAYADKVIVTAGGKASPNLGSNGSGYALLKEFGHTISELRPSLVQIKTNTETVKKLKGIKVNARVMLGKTTEEGEVLFTDYGLSGPPIFSLSAKLGSQKSISLDIMPEYDSKTLYSIIFERCSRLCDTRLENFFVGMLNKKIGQALFKEAGIIPLSKTASELNGSDIGKLVKCIKNWRFEIKGTMSWNNAQVTKGGALTDEFDDKTMESRLVKGLYAAGEILDIDGDCGGYNLQWAWSSGFIAGRSCADD